ncbi:hypothetical protein BGZ90_000708 [Linnemannia elongata]|nr:hypothetical protein BGZ90_000708 [Linnemannia elongata]
MGTLYLKDGETNPTLSRSHVDVLRNSAIQVPQRVDINLGIQHLAPTDDDDYDHNDLERLEDIATSILQDCLKLKHLNKFDCEADEEEGVDDVCILKSHGREYAGVLLYALCRFDPHSKSIKSIIFGECFAIRTRSLTAIFILTNLKELKLCLRLDEEQEAPYEAEMFFSNPMPCWTLGLERLYRQVRCLPDLRILGLRIAVERNIPDSYDDEITTYKDKTFVGMLTLKLR